jgi:hypothetical protein
MVSGGKLLQAASWYAALDSRYFRYTAHRAANVPVAILLCRAVVAEPLAAGA